MREISFGANLICFLEAFEHLFVAFLRTVCVIRKLLVKFACLFPELVRLFQRLFEFSVIFKLYPLLSVLLPEVGDVIYKLALFFRTDNFSLLPKFKMVNFALELAKRKSACDSKLSLSVVCFREKVVRLVINAVPLFLVPVSYTHLRAHETGRNLVCRL